MRRLAAFVIVAALTVPVGLAVTPQPAEAHGAYHHHGCRTHFRQLQAVDLWSDPSGHSLHSSNIGTYFNPWRWANERWEYHEHWYASSQGMVYSHTNEKVRYCGDWRI